MKGKMTVSSEQGARRAAAEPIVRYYEVPCVYGAVPTLSEHEIDDVQTQLWHKEHTIFMQLARDGILPGTGQRPGVVLGRRLSWSRLAGGLAVTIECAQTRRHETIVWADRPHKDGIKRPCVLTMWRGRFDDRPAGSDSLWAWSLEEAWESAGGGFLPEPVLEYHNLRCSRAAAEMLLELEVDQWEAKLHSEGVSLIMAARQAGALPDEDEHGTSERLMRWRVGDGLAVGIKGGSPAYDYCGLWRERTDATGKRRLCIVTAWPGSLDARPRDI